MKNFLLAAGLILTGTIASAQQDDPQPNDDQLQQQAPRETQRQVERDAKIDAAMQQAKTDFEAEKSAKEKGSTQKATSAQKAHLDSVTKPKSPKPQLQPAPQRN